MSQADDYFDQGMCLRDYDSSEDLELPEGAVWAVWDEDHRWGELRVIRFSDGSCLGEIWDAYAEYQIAFVAGPSVEVVVEALEVEACSAYDEQNDK